MKRRTSRENAFILIFESFFLNLAVNDLVNLAEEKQNIKLSKYSKELIFGVLQNRENLDKNISKYLKNWEFNRISKILVAILEISFYEILYIKDMAYSISINEAVELEKKYFGHEGPSFVNGVLGSFVKDI